MRSVYVAPGCAWTTPDACAGVEVSPLLRELILRIVELGLLEGNNREHQVLLDLFLIGLGAAERLPTRLVLPRDRRGRCAAERLMAEPSRQISLPELARLSGASSRTLQRIFLEETGLGFAEWRQRARLAHAAGLLSASCSVTEAGLDAGYGSTSAFSAAFGRAFGCTPGAFRTRVC